jgi:parallel beta-helix repeat protein
VRLFLPFILLASALSAETVYVSPHGRPDWTGKLADPNQDQSDGPLRSLTAARDRVRELRKQGKQGAMTVEIRGGTYHLSEPFTLTADDSGTTYSAYQREHPIISGGERIDGWKQGEGKLWTASANGRFRELFVGGRRAQRARTPTNGFYRIDGPSSQDKPFLLKFRGNDVKKSWEGKGVEVVALLAWAEIRMPIASVDEANHTARLTGNPRPSNKELDARYWIENAPDALDAPGEWFHDEANKLLKYWPVPGDDLMKDEVVVPRLQQLVRVEGKPEAGQLVHDVVFRGLDFRHTDWSMEANGYADTQAAIEATAAFEAIGAENVSIEHCTFAQMGGYGIWFGRGSKRNRVVNTEIFDMGAGGVKLGETRMRDNPSERNSGNVITDNDIHDLGLVYPAAVGIWVGQSSGNTLSHNHIHDLYYTAISVGWTWGYAANQCSGNKIEYNHLHDIGRNMLSDMGAIYTLGVQPGTVIRNNVIHDIYSFTYGGWGIYPDEGSSNILIENNIVYRTKSAGFHQHYGRENIVRNNVFAFGKEFQLMRTRAEPHLSFTFENNIVYFDEGRLLGSNWTGDHFRMQKNIYWDTRGNELQFSGRSWQEWQKEGHDAGSAIADPMFVNAGSYNFKPLPDSPALKLGFKPIETEDVGPRAPAGAAR